MKIYLVQRGEINRPLNDYLGERFSRAVDLDYMGRAEFEFGATAKGLRDIQAQRDQFKLVTFRDIKRNDSPLRVYHMLSDEDYGKYMQVLQGIWLDNAKNEDTIERTYFYQNAEDYQLKTDLWWDLKNCVIWSFNKHFMMRVHHHLEVSWKYMDEQKALRDSRQS